MSPELVSSRTPRQPLKRHELFERFLYRYWARWTGHTRNIQGYDLGGRPSRGKPYKRNNNGGQQGFELLHINSSSGRDLVEKLGHIRKYERNENEHRRYRK
jgi:hypothetical protein